MGALPQGNSILLGKENYIFTVITLRFEEGAVMFLVTE